MQNAINNSDIDKYLSHPVSSLIAVCLLILIGIGIYSNTFKAQFAFDDTVNIVNNKYIRMQEIRFKTIENLFKSPAKERPTANFSFALNYYFGKYNVIGYHLVNIAIHLLAGIFLFLILKLTLSLPSAYTSESYPEFVRIEIISFLTALLWLVNPLQTESVTYIVQRMNSMAAMFYLLALLAYIKGRRIQCLQTLTDGPYFSKRIIAYTWFATAGLAGIFALTSKQNAVTLPFVIILYEWFFFQNLKYLRRSRVGWYAAISISLLVIAVLVYFGGDPLAGLLKLYARQTFTPIQRIMSEWRVLIYYVSLIFFPLAGRLNIDYNYPISYSLLDPPTTIIALIAIVSLLGLAVYTAKKDRLLSFAIIWFFGNLLLESSFLGLALIFEHRTYLPSMMVCMIFILLIFRYVRPKSFAFSMIVMAIVVSAFWSYQRNAIWQNPMSLWKDCLKKSPHDARANYNLAFIYHLRGDLDQALIYYRRTLKCHPEKAGLLSRTYTHMGNVFIKKQQLGTAVVYLLKAIHVDPNSSKAYLNLGDAFLKENRINEAIKCYQTTIQLSPENAKAYNNYGKALVLQHKLSEAMSEFRAAIRINPDFAEAHNNLGNVLISKGRIKEAVSAYEKALAIEPQNIRVENNLGLAYARIGQFNNAIRHFENVLTIFPSDREAKKSFMQIKSLQEQYCTIISKINERLTQYPDNPQSYFQIGEINRRFNKIDDAIDAYKKALTLSPGNPDVLFSLAVVYSSRRQYDRAINYFEKAGRAKSIRTIAYYNVACLYARQNKINDTVKWLKKAIESGYDDWTKIRSDPDLAGIRDTAWYKEIMKRH